MKIIGRFLLGLTSLVVLAQIGGGVYLFVKARPLYENIFRPFYIQLTGKGVQIKKKINLQVDTHIPLTSAIDTDIEIPIKKNVMLNLPIRGNINIGIDEPFTIPVNGPINVSMDHEFKITKEIEIKSRLPLDQYVQTRLLGMDTRIPIKGIVPIDLTIPFDEMIRIRDNFALTTTAPLNCQIQHDFNIPVDFSVNSQFSVDEVIPVPVKTDVKTNIRLTGDLPCYIYLTILWDKDKGLVVEHTIKLE